MAGDLNEPAIIRAWQKKDLPAVIEIARSTWLDAYLAFVPKADILQYHEEQYTIDRLTELFQNRFGYVAETNGRAVGYSIAGIFTEKNRYGIQSIYVLPRFQSRGIGIKLLQAQMAKAQSLNHDRVWLAVMEKNRPACEWYKSIGFVFLEREFFQMGNTTLKVYIGYKLIRPE